MSAHDHAEAGHGRHAGHSRHRPGYRSNDPFTPSIAQRIHNHRSSGRVRRMDDVGLPPRPHHQHYPQQLGYYSVPAPVPPPVVPPYRSYPVAQAQPASWPAQQPPSQSPPSGAIQGAPIIISSSPTPQAPVIIQPARRSYPSSRSRSSRAHSRRRSSSRSRRSRTPSKTERSRFSRVDEEYDGGSPQDHRSDRGRSRRRHRSRSPDAYRHRLRARSRSPSIVETSPLRRPPGKIFDTELLESSPVSSEISSLPVSVSSLASSLTSVRHPPAVPIPSPSPTDSWIVPVLETGRHTPAPYSIPSPAHSHKSEDRIYTIPGAQPHPLSEPILKDSDSNNMNTESLRYSRPISPASSYQSYPEKDVLEGYGPLKLRDYVIAFITDTLPQQIYLHFLLRLPSLYFSRVDRIFQEADLTMEEIKEMALQATAEDNKTFRNNMLSMGHYYHPETTTLSPAYQRLKTQWEHFIDSLMREWKTLNIVSVLLLSAIMTMFQIQGAAEDPVTRNLAFWSLICALLSLLYGCLFIIRFGTMKKASKAAEWALEARISQTILWNVWVMLSMPVVWLAWSILTFIACLMSFMWRAKANLPSDFVFSAPSPTELAFRIFICAVLGIGVIYGALIINTFKRYGTQMDEAWKSRVQSFINEPDPGFPQPLPPPSPPQYLPQTTPPITDWTRIIRVPASVSRRPSESDSDQNPYLAASIAPRGLDKNTGPDSRRDQPMASLLLSRTPSRSRAPSRAKRYHNSGSHHSNRKRYSRSRSTRSRSPSLPWIHSPSGIGHPHEKSRQLTPPPSHAPILPTAILGDVNGSESKPWVQLNHSRSYLSYDSRRRSPPHTDWDLPPTEIPGEPPHVDRLQSKEFSREMQHVRDEGLNSGIPPLVRDSAEAQPKALEDCGATDSDEKHLRPIV